MSMSSNTIPHRAKLVQIPESTDIEIPVNIINSSTKENTSKLLSSNNSSMSYQYSSSSMSSSSNKYDLLNQPILSTSQLKFPRKSSTSSNISSSNYATEMSSSSSFPNLQQAVTQTHSIPPAPPQGPPPPPPASPPPKLDRAPQIAPSLINPSKTFTIPGIYSSPSLTPKFSHQQQQTDKPKTSSSIRFHYKFIYKY
jgi:hypothetical protein